MSTSHESEIISFRDSARVLRAIKGYLDRLNEGLAIQRAVGDTDVSEIEILLRENTLNAISEELNNAPTTKKILAKHPPEGDVLDSRHNGPC